VTGGGIYPGLEARLCQHFGLAAGDHEGVKRALGGCDRWGAPVYSGPALEEAPFEAEAAFPHEKVVRGIWGTWDGMETYFDGVEHPLKSAETVADIEAHPWPDPGWFDCEHVRWFTDPPDEALPVARWAEREQDYARLAGGWSPVFSRIMDLCGMETGLMHIAYRPDLIHAMVAHIGDFLEAHYRRMAQAGQGYLDVLVYGDDFAGQDRMLLSPRSWRDYFLPLWRRLFAIAHHYGMKNMMHSCGAVRPVIRDLVDAGLDILEVVQIRANGMRPEELKREFGAHLAFYGGIDVQELMPCGTPGEVRCEVRRLSDILGEGGRYILSTSHFLMDDVPVENVVALYDEARSYWPDQQ
jgi:uroporphyrinogen decarboxylase